MRLTTVGLGVFALVFAAGTAFAAGGGTSGAQSGKGSSESRGGAGPGGGSGGSSSAAPAGGSRGVENPDVLPEEVPEKPWEVGGLWESHRLIRQNDLAGGDAVNGSPYSGAGSNKQFNVLGVYGQYDITEYDRVKVRAYIYERFIADPGETGFRFDDIIVSYTRRIPLPNEFTFRPLVWVTAPTSFASQKQGLVTAPRLLLDLEKKFGKYVTASGRTYGDAYITRYRTAEGGAPNPKYGLRFGADLEVAMPFHTALSLGMGAAMGYTWYYEVNTTGDANANVQRNGTVGDTTFPNQPISQSYSGEIFARYVLPPIIGVRSDILLALAQGDPSLGSQSVLHDGVAHIYPGWRTTSELYAALTVRY